MGFAKKLHFEIPHGFIKWAEILFFVFCTVFLFYKINYQTPILMYHHVGNPASPEGLNVSYEDFERQMLFLKAHRYNVISLSELVQIIKSKKRIPWNTVVITFDDGHSDNAMNAARVLKKIGFPATIFVITEKIDQQNYLSRQDLRELDSLDISIGSHTVNHSFIPEITAMGDLIYQIRESKNQLEKILGHPVRLFSYPAGGVTQKAKAMLPNEGYDGAVTTNYGENRFDPYALKRIKVKGGPRNLFTFWLKTTGFYHLGKRCVPIE